MGWRVECGEGEENLLWSLRDLRSFQAFKSYLKRNLMSWVWLVSMANNCPKSLW